MKKPLRDAARYHALQIAVAAIALAPLAWRLAQPIVIAGVHVTGTWTP